MGRTPEMNDPPLRRSRRGEEGRSGKEWVMDTPPYQQKSKRIPTKTGKETQKDGETLHAEEGDVQPIFEAGLIVMRRD